MELILSICLSRSILRHEQLEIIFAYSANTVQSSKMDVTTDLKVIERHIHLIQK